MRLAANEKNNRATLRASGDHFTGVVWADFVMKVPERVNVMTVFCEPKARSNWHRHSEGQVLLVGEGRGLVATDSGDVVSVGRGDVVYAEPGELHWHGAAEDAFLQFTAIPLGSAEVLGPVTDAEYAVAASKGSPA